MNANTSSHPSVQGLFTNQSPHLKSWTSSSSFMSFGLLLQKLQSSVLFELYLCVSFNRYQNSNKSLMYYSLPYLVIKQRQEAFHRSKQVMICKYNHSIYLISLFCTKNVYDIEVPGGVLYSSYRTV